MEEFISGLWIKKNICLMINSYMFVNVCVFVVIVCFVGKDDIVIMFDVKVIEFCKFMFVLLWDVDVDFFKVCFEDGLFVDVCEVIGFILWYFGLFEKNVGYEIVWC